MDHLGPQLWCSLADRVSNAWVSVPTEDGEQRLFAISLRDPSIPVYLSDRKARGSQHQHWDPRVRTHCGRADGEDLLAACLDSVTRAVATAYRTRHHLGEGHGHILGANPGVREDRWLQVGGCDVRTRNEDIALAAAIRARTPHWVSIDSTRVLTSGRTSGRAAREFADYLNNMAGQAQ